MEFAADAPKPATGGQVTLFVNDKAVGGGRMDHTVPIRFSGYAGMDIGRDNGGVVDRSYARRSPFPFTGTVRKVVFDIKPHLEHEEAELHEVAAARRRRPRPERLTSQGRRCRRWQVRRPIDVLMAGYLSKEAAQRGLRVRPGQRGGHSSGSSS